MSDFNSEILRAAEKAAQVSRWESDPRRSSFDIVGAILKLGIPIMCRPLEGLQGATITVDEDTQGVLLATWPLFSVQRFTLAHELGHIVLGHRLKFDKTVGKWLGRTPGENTVQEIAADTFAAGVLAPRRRIAMIARQQGWRVPDFRHPPVVYQLALRLGVSFEATCIALERANLIPQAAQTALAETSLKEIKRSIAGSDLTDAWADVWDLSMRDVGSFIEAGPNDVFRFRAEEKASAGYLWKVESPLGLRVSEQHRIADGEYGAPNAREMRVRIPESGTHAVSLAHVRPWNQDLLERLDLTIENWGKERDGLCRRMRVETIAMVEA